jgi:hypothetical protein
MNDELEMIWDEVVVAYSRYYLWICLEGRRKSMKYHRIADIMAGIRTEYLRNTNLER